jgi:hypothetical protein
MCHVSRAPHGTYGSRSDASSLPREEARQFPRGAGIPAARTGSLTVTVDKEHMTHRLGRRSRDRQARVVIWGTIVEPQAMYDYTT